MSLPFSEMLRGGIRRFAMRESIVSTATVPVVSQSSPHAVGGSTIGLVDSTGWFSLWVGCGL